MGGMKGGGRQRTATQEGINIRRDVTEECKKSLEATEALEKCTFCLYKTSPRSSFNPLKKNMSMSVWCLFHIPDKVASPSFDSCGDTDRSFFVRPYTRWKSSDVLYLQHRWTSSMTSIHTSLRLLWDNVQDKRLHSHRVLAMTLFFLGCWLTGLPTGFPFFSEPFLAISLCFSAPDTGVLKTHSTQWRRR